MRTETALDIISFIQHPDLLDDRTSSEAQLTVFKATFGLPLTHREQEIYLRATGRESYDSLEQFEITIIGGRRGGKTGKLAASMILYQAFREHGLPPGEEGHIVLLARNLRQARIAFVRIRQYLRRSKLLTKRVISTTKNEIRLDNDVVIGCFPSTHEGLRGRTILAAVCDEIAFWPSGDERANSAEDVLGALRPAMARY